MNKPYNGLAGRTANNPYFYSGPGRTVAKKEMVKLPEVGSWWVDMGTSKVVQVSSFNKNTRAVLISTFDYKDSWTAVNIDRFFNLFKPSPHKYHLVNGRLCVAPEAGPLEYGLEYWSMYSEKWRGVGGPKPWSDTNVDRRNLKNGNVFLKQEHRDAYQKAMQSCVDKLETD